MTERIDTRELTIKWRTEQIDELKRRVIRYSACSLIGSLAAGAAYLTGLDNLAPLGFAISITGFGGILLNSAKFAQEEDHLSDIRKGLYDTALSY